MKATQARLLEFLKKADQFVIPIYQRTYSWRENECRQLWDDIVRTGKNDKVSAHFVGSIVYVEKEPYGPVSSQSPLLVIDGQQRLTTVTLLIEALARQLGSREPLDGFSAKKLRNYYLLNDLEDGEKRYKLILSQTDKASLTAILDQQPPPKDCSLRIQDNFEFFKIQFADADVIQALCKGLMKLIVVDISLNHDQDNPQLIFESLNSTGLELSQADLIRNFILMGLETRLQIRLFEYYWRPMEVNFGQEAYATQFDSFMRHYLTVKTGEIPNVQAVYNSFKQYARSGQVESPEQLVADIRTYAGYYCAMALGSEPDSDLKIAFHDLRELRVDVAYLSSWSFTTTTPLAYSPRPTFCGRPGSSRATSSADPSAAFRRTP
jgi:uncharacterized protein with ParB-like and HNH nuclease domain